MKRTSFSFLLFVFVLIPFFSRAKTIIDTPETGGLFDAGEKPQLISKQFGFTEGASVDKKGNVFFTDQPNNKIWEYSTDGKLSVFLADALHSNGTYFDKKGNLVSCAETKDQLIAISPTGKIKVLVADFQGHRLNGPNDAWIAPDGGIYFTDPYYQRDFWDRKKPDLDGQNVYYLPKNSNSAIVVVSDLKKPNGIIGTPDGKHLYIADIEGNKTFKYTISADGALSDKQLFVKQGSDGMTLDEKGNVYITGKGVTIYNPAGIKIAHIDIDEPWTANLCFAGKNRDELFITASKAIYIIHMKVKGVE
ncbi:MAG: SMP-30/gluconolactonase/LRE family protein [Mucilaginibacter sp.]|nr:SMP-30/gluconolactonase/LRE family protein [Mucilaginibacter sp.]